MKNGVDIYVKRLPGELQFNPYHSNTKNIKQYWFIFLKYRLYSEFTYIPERNCHFPVPGRNCMTHRQALQDFLDTSQVSFHVWFFYQ
jgi:hypothetical protein